MSDVMFDSKAVRAAHERAGAQLETTDIVQSDALAQSISTLKGIRFAPKNILICGSFLTQTYHQLRTLYPDADIYCLSTAVTQLAACEDCPNKVCGDFQQLPVQSSSFDMVYLSFCMSQVDHLAGCFQEVARVMRPEGLLMMTLLGPDTLHGLRQGFASCHGFWQQFPDMHDVADVLLQCQFKEPMTQRDTVTVRYRSLNTLFSDLKQVGGVNTHPMRLKGLFGKQRWQQAMSILDQHKQHNTYDMAVEIIQVHAWRIMASHQHGNEYPIHFT